MTKEMERAINDRINYLKKEKNYLDCDRNDLTDRILHLKKQIQNGRK